MDEEPLFDNCHASEFEGKQAAFVERLWSPKVNKVAFTNCNEIYANENKELEDNVINTFEVPICIDDEVKADLEVYVEEFVKSGAFKLPSWIDECEIKLCYHGIEEGCEYDGLMENFIPKKVSWQFVDQTYVLFLSQELRIQMNMEWQPQCFPRLISKGKPPPNCN